MKKVIKKIVCALSISCVLFTMLAVPISATEETTENDASNFSITEGNQGMGVYTDLREMVYYTVYPDDINTTNFEERDGSNYYYELSLPVGTVVPWEYFSDMRAGSTYFDGKGQPSAIRAVVGYTLENVEVGNIHSSNMVEGQHFDGFLNLYIFTVSASDTALSSDLRNKNPDASFYFLFSRNERNSVGAVENSYIAFPCIKTGDDYVIGQAYYCHYGHGKNSSGLNVTWKDIAEIKDNKIELWGWQTYNLDGTYTNISDSFYFKLNPSVLGLFKVLDGRTVPYTYLQAIQSYGYDEGYWSGHSEGFDDGLQQGRKNWYQPRYDKGYSDGYKKGNTDLSNYYSDYWSTHYNSIAYGDAVQDSIESNDSNPVTAFFTSMWNGVLDAYDIVTQNVSVGGVSLAMVITTIVLAVVVIWVIKVLKP